MKLLSKCAAAIFLLCLTLFAATGAQAQVRPAPNSSFVGTITNAGQVSIGGVTAATLYVTSSSDNVRYEVVLPQLGGNGMLAVGLTAMSLGKNITVQTDSSGVTFAVYANN